MPNAPAQSPGPARNPQWRVGALVGGRYKLRSPLGAGAMGAVWLADHVSLGTTVAVKLVDTADREDAAELLSRFQLEARAAAQLKSPHVVQILDHGVDGHVAFMAMEHLEGESLERRLQRRGRLGPSELAHVLREMARGVDRAHAAGIVHRDLKPPNVFIARLDGAEIVKVLDFGIAKMLGAPRDAHLQTQAGFVVGTPAYMSPEQVLGKPVDHRSDLWQMAIIAFECLTGRRPFDGGSLGQLFMAVCTLPIPVPSSVAPVPPAFDAWFARAASRDPLFRFHSAGEMAEALGAILAPGGVGESAIPTMAQSNSRPDILLPGGTGRSEAWSTARVEPARRASPVALIAGMVLAPVSVAVVGGAFWLAKHRHVADPIALTSTTVTAVAAGTPAPKAAAAEPAPSLASTTSAAVAATASAAATANAAATGSAAKAGKPPAGVTRAPPGAPRPGGGKAPIDLGI